MSPEERAIVPKTPRDRLVYFGPTALSNKELLSVVLGTGTGGERGHVLAERLLTEPENLIDLARLSLIELMEQKGVGEAKAAQVQAALELGRRLTLEAIDQRQQIRAPADAANILMPSMILLEQETLQVMMLNSRNYVIGIHEVYKGSLNTAMVRVADIFREPIRRNSLALIVAHNHPSGDPSPSPEDVTMTREVINAGRLLDIEVLDHLIIGHGRFVSLKERGLAFE